jgi:hypothetical protein
MLPLDGRINGAERYAIDWSRFDLGARPIVDLSAGTQATFRGDPTRNENYFTFDQPVIAVADATVVASWWAICPRRLRTSSWTCRSRTWAATGSSSTSVAARTRSMPT